MVVTLLCLCLWTRSFRANGVLASRSASTPTLMPSTFGGGSLVYESYMRSSQRLSLLQETVIAQLQSRFDERMHGTNSK